MSVPSDLEEIFFAALARDKTEERAAFLEDTCRNEPETRGEVERLLAAHARLDDFLEQPSTAVAAAAEKLRVPVPGEAELGFLKPPTHPESLGRLGHYEILEVVGSGGFGVVLRAFDDKLQRAVAIKTLSQSLVGSATARQRFVREARAAAAINHDNVVHIYEVEEAAPVPYLVMEYVAGSSLDEKLRQEGPLKLDDVLSIGLQMAHGLAAAHQHGLVHRDIKPANILLEDATGRVKITDFGLARTVDDASISRDGILAGTPEFMSPEQARGAGLDQRSDLFSLGSVLYAMCTGRSPFHADGSLAVLRRIVHDTPQAIKELRPDTLDALAALIARLHAKDPAERPQSAGEFMQALQRCRDGSLRHGPRWASISRRTVVAGLVAAAAGAGGMAFFGWVRHANNRGDDNRRDSPPAPPPALPPVASRPPRVLFVVPSVDFYYAEVGPLRNHIAMYDITWRIASTSMEECRPTAVGAPPLQAPVKPDLLIGDAKAADFDAIYFCGGIGIEEFAARGSAAADAKHLIDEALASNRIVAACGMGVVVLAEADALRGRQAACYPYGQPPGTYARRIAARGALCSDGGIVEDGAFLTGGAPQHIRALGQALVKRLGIEPLPRGSPANPVN